VLLGEGVYLLEVVHSFADVCDVLLLFLPEHVGLAGLAYHYLDEQGLGAHEHELELGGLAESGGSHPGELEFVEFQSELLVDELVSLFVDGVAVDVVLSEGHLVLRVLSFGAQAHEH